MEEYNIKQIFEEIENELILSMKRTLWWHKKDEKAKDFKWPQWQAMKLKQMEDFRKNNQEIFKKYSKQINFLTKIQMKKQFREGASRTNKEAIKLGKIKKEDAQLSGSFFGLNDRKIKALINSVDKDLKDVRVATLRMANDQYRQAIYKAEMFVGTGAKTVQQAIDMATKKFLAKGFNCIEYSNGSRHNIADYCDMAIRTANKRANLMGEGEMRKKLGNSLVYISRHEGSCDKCSHWQGRVYIDDVWSGGKKEDDKYPLLSTAIEGGLFHPRCQHGASTYYAGVNEEPAEVTQALNNEHEDEYTQALQRQKRQYERLALGSLLPENVLSYQNKVNELQNQIESSKIDLSEDEQYAINQYISSESYKINEALRNNLELNRERKKVILGLDKILSKLPNYEGNIVRALEIKDKKLLQKFLNKNQIGKIRQWKEYLSFSNKENYNENANIRIYVKSTMAKDIRRYNRDESEILYKRNSKFVTKNIVKSKDIYYILWEEINE